MRNLSEQQIIAGFDIYLQSCLHRAKRERVLDADTSTFDVDISGRALALFYAAVTSINPPSIPIPLACELNPYTSPPSLSHFTNHWVRLVPVIASLPSHAKFDLARILCGRAPLLYEAASCLSPIEPRRDITSLATELHFLGSQLDQWCKIRQGFSAAIASEGDGSNLSPTRPTPLALLKDLSHSGPDRMQNYSMPSRPMTGTEGKATSQDIMPHANFVPCLRPLPSIPTPRPSPKPAPRRKQSTPLPPKPSPVPLPIRALSLPIPSSAPSSSSGTTAWLSSPSRSSKQELGTSGQHERSASTPLLVQTPTCIDPPWKTTVPPAMLLIRETFYVAIAEVLSAYPRLHARLQKGCPRTYNSVISLAILAISISSLSSNGTSIRTVFGKDISIADITVDEPTAKEGGSYRNFVAELVGIGRQGHQIIEGDDERAIAYAMHGRVLPDPRMDRIRCILETGVELVDEQAKKNPDGREYGLTMLFALRIHRLATCMVKLNLLGRRNS